MALKKIGLNKWRVTASVRDKNKGYPITKQRVVEGTRAEAVIAESDLLKELRARSLTSAYAVTFGDAIDLHIQYLRVKGRLSTKWEALYNQVRRDLGHIRIEVFAEHFGAYLTGLINTATCRGKPHANGTINRRVAVVRAVFNRLVELKLLDKNPITKSDFPRYEENPRDRYLSQEERLRLLHAIKVHRPHILPIVRYMMSVPCRVSELTGARRGQYSPITNTIYIPYSKAGIPIYKPVPPDMTGYFRSIPDDCPWLFYCEYGGGYHPLTHRINSAWKYCLRTAGIIDFRLHDLRHMAATDLIMAGNSERGVMDIAGWKTNMLSTYWKQDSFRSATSTVFRQASGNVVPLSAAV